MPSCSRASNSSPAFTDIDSKRLSCAWNFRQSPTARSGVAKAVGIDKPNECHPQSQDDQCSTNNHNVTPRSATGDACLARSIARRSAPSRRGFQCGFSGRGNEAPAGEKPSGLPARLQETSVKARSPDFLRSPDHTVQLRLRPGKSSGADCRRLKHDGSRHLSVAGT